MWRDSASLIYLARACIFRVLSSSCSMLLNCWHVCKSVMCNCLVVEGLKCKTVVSESEMGLTGSYFIHFLSGSPLRVRYWQSSKQHTVRINKFIFSSVLLNLLMNESAYTETMATAQFH
jgi:hypothetical protein